MFYTIGYHRWVTVVCVFFVLAGYLESAQGSGAHPEPPATERRMRIHFERTGGIAGMRLMMRRSRSLSAKLEEPNAACGLILTRCRRGSGGL